MLHQPTQQFHVAEAPPAFDAKTFVAEMRATGADLLPIRGPEPRTLCGRYSIVTENADASAMHEVLERHAAMMASKSIDVGAVADFLFYEAATKRAVASIGKDLSKGLAEVRRLDRIRREACEAETALLDAYENQKPLPPKEIRWHPFNGLDADHTTTIRDGKYITIYSDEGIEALRTKPRSFERSPTDESMESFFLGDDVEPRTEAEREWLARRLPELRQRACLIVKAHDDWKAACLAASIETGLHAAGFAADEAGNEFFTARDYLLSLPITNATDASAKALLAMEFADEDEMKDVLAEVADFFKPADIRNQGDRKLISACRRAEKIVAKDAQLENRLSELTDSFMEIENDLGCPVPEGPCRFLSGTSQEMRAEVKKHRSKTSPEAMAAMTAYIKRVADWEHRLQEAEDRHGLTGAKRDSAAASSRTRRVLAELSSIVSTTANGLAAKSRVMAACLDAGYGYDSQFEDLARSIFDDGIRLGGRG